MLFSNSCTHNVGWCSYQCAVSWTDSITTWRAWAQLQRTSVQHLCSAITINMIIIQHPLCPFSLITSYKVFLFLISWRQCFDSQGVYPSCRSILLTSQKVSVWGWSWAVAALYCRSMGPVTVQLIKLKHYDSSVTLSLFVSFPPKQSHTVPKGRPLGCGRAWTRALGRPHKKHNPTSPGSDTAVQSVAVTYSKWCLLLAEASDKDPYLSNWDKLWSLLWLWGIFCCVFSAPKTNSLSDYFDIK